MVTDVTGEWHQEELLERELGQYREEEATCNGCAGYPKYDQVTGLLSFNRFREEVDSVIASGKGKSCLLVYTDLETLNILTGNTVMQQETSCCGNLPVILLIL